MIERDMEKGLTSLSQNHYGEDSVALSTSEAEYIAASEGGKEVVGKARQGACLHPSYPPGFRFYPKSCTNIYEDNLAAVAMSTNPVRRKYSRHNDIYRHHVRELALAGVIKLVALGTHDMVADALTKSQQANLLSP